jgi:hypothetical protein
MYTLAAMTGLALATTAQAGPHGGSGYKPSGGNKKMSSTWSKPTSSSHYSSKKMLSTSNPGGFTGTPKPGMNRSYKYRPGYWGRRTWNASCGCYCYWSPDAGCYYYYCAPDECYYPLAYCPYGTYDYAGP